MSLPCLNGVVAPFCSLNLPATGGLTFFSLSLVYPESHVFQLHPPLIFPIPSPPFALGLPRTDYVNSYFVSVHWTSSVAVTKTTIQVWFSFVFFDTVNSLLWSLPFSDYLSSPEACDSCRGLLSIWSDNMTTEWIRWVVYILVALHRPPISWDQISSLWRDPFGYFFMVCYCRFYGRKRLKFWF